MTRRVHVIAIVTAIAGATAIALGFQSYLALGVIVAGHPPSRS